jgi:hypothetical protein
MHSSSTSTAKAEEEEHTLKTQAQQLEAGRCKQHNGKCHTLLFHSPLDAHYKAEVNFFECRNFMQSNN